MKLNQMFFLGLISITISSLSYADLYEPVPQCYQPSKPLWFATAYYTERYEHDIRAYQTCMKAFIVKEERAIKMHQKAAQQALKSWNNFIKNK